MGLLDDLEYRAPQQNCKVRSIAESLDEADRSVFMEAVNNTDWAATTLATQLTQRGIKITKDPIQKHRKKICSCSRI